jgi:hypothetical protein
MNFAKETGACSETALVHYERKSQLFLPCGISVEADREFILSQYIFSLENCFLRYGRACLLYAPSLLSVPFQNRADPVSGATRHPCSIYQMLPIT